MQSNINLIHESLIVKHLNEVPTRGLIEQDYFIFEFFINCFILIVNSTWYTNGFTKFNWIHIKFKDVFQAS